MQSLFLGVKVEQSEKATFMTMGSVGATITDSYAIEVGRKFANLFGGKFYQLQAPAIASTRQERDVFIKHPQIHCPHLELKVFTSSRLCPRAR